MDLDCHTAQWIASVERSDLGYTYVRLYADTPEAIRNCVINRFGKGPARQDTGRNKSKGGCSTPQQTLVSFERPQPTSRPTARRWVGVPGWRTPGLRAGSFAFVYVRRS